MKKFISGLLIGLFLTYNISVGAQTLKQYVAKEINYPVLVNGEKFTSDKPIVSIDGSTYLPLETTGKVLGVSVMWNSEKSRVEIGKTGTISLLTANDYCNKLRNAGLSVNDVVVYTKETDSGELLGKPNQYTSKVVFSDSNLELDKDYPIYNSIEVFATTKDAIYRKNLLDKTWEAAGVRVWHIFINNNVLLYLNSNTTLEQATKYLTEFVKIK